MVRPVWSLLFFAFWSCKKAPDANSPELEPFRVAQPKPHFASEATFKERSGSGEIAYLGLDAAPLSPKRGEVVELTHYFAVRSTPTGDYDIFVHGDVPGEGGRVLVADHAPLFGKLPMRAWKVGDIWADRHRVKIPDDAAASHLELYVGIFKNEARWTVQAAPGAQDGQNRLRAATLKLDGPAPADDLPVATLKPAGGAIIADGVLDEAGWANAEVLTFADSMGRGVPLRFPTRLRLLWDETNLYVGFEATDGDITERYGKRDDPIYEHETVELFLMPHAIAPALGPYVELQASPGGIIFDASFDGRRQGMNVAYDAGQTVGTRIDGTLNDPAADRGWVSEWVVPWRNIRGVSAPPKVGDEWRLNAFRIEKFREGGQQQGEYSAWSPPRVGDFHNVARFGRLRFAAQ